MWGKRAKEMRKEERHSFTAASKKDKGYKIKGKTNHRNK